MTDLSVPCGKKPPHAWRGRSGVTAQTRCELPYGHHGGHDTYQLTEGFDRFCWVEDLCEPDPLIVRALDRLTRWLRARLT